MKRWLTLIPVLTMFAPVGTRAADQDDILHTGERLHVEERRQLDVARRMNTIVRRIGWLLQQPVAAVVLELGANDMLRGQDPAQLRDNLQAIIDEIRAPFPQAPIVIAGMRAAPNLGPDYAREFERVFEQVARANSAALLPFILDGVAGQPELNQADGIHPTAAGQQRVAANVWAVLRPLLGEVAQ